MTLPDAEVVVVGGGPAGSMTAMLLARAGHDVVLLEKATFPRHKPCSEYINAGGVAVLREVGLLPDILAVSPHRLSAMRVFSPDRTVFTADFERAQPGEFALGLSRYQLDDLLLTRAKENGVRVFERAHVRDVLKTSKSVHGVSVAIEGVRTEVSASVVVGADGHNSVISRKLGLDRSRSWPRRTGLAAHFRGTEGLAHFGEMHVTDWGYIGLAPLEDGLTNVAVVLSDSAVHNRQSTMSELFEQHIESVPDMQRKMANAFMIGSLRGSGSMARRVKRTSGNGYLLVGDAAGFLDPFTGDGIYEALSAATFAAPVISAALHNGECSADALKPYQIARRRELMMKRQVSWIVQAFLHQPRLMNYVTPRLSEREDIGLTLSGVLGNFRPASQALSPIFLAKMLRP